jgi:hypothetical protein
MHDFKPARQTLRESLLHQERRRPEQDHLERTTGARILVPEALDGLRPAWDLLHLVQDHDRSPLARLRRRQSAALPLRGKPCAVADRRLIRGDEDVR